MKKYLLICALAVTGMAFAANQANLSKVTKTKMTANQKIEAVSDGNHSEIAIIGQRKAIRAKQAEYATADFYYADGAFHNGLMEGLMGFSFAAIILPYQDSIKYTNIYGPTNWSINGQLQAENTKIYYDNYGIGDGVYYVPETSDHDYTVGGTTYRIKGSSYGNTADKAYVFSSLSEHSSMLGGDNLPMTLCAMHCDTLVDTHDYWRIGGGATADPYFNGTGIHLDSADRVTTADTLGILVDNLSVMKFDKIIFAIYADGVGDTASVIPDGAELKLELFPLTDAGIDFENPIASTVITQENLNVEPQSWGMIGTMSAIFKETDIFSTETEVPVWVNGSFFLQLTNFNETNCNFGIFADYNCPVTATTVYKYKGEWRYRGKKNGGGEYGQNLLISFDGYFPTLFNDTTINELNAPIEGGYAFFGNDTEDAALLAYSNVNPSEWDIESDEDWVEVELDDQYYADYNAVFVEFNAQALPEGESYRETTVTINADGAILEILIRQGENPGQAIDNVDFKHDGKNYNVLGIEVNDDYKGVIIRNGEKFIR